LEAAFWRKDMANLDEPNGAPRNGERDEVADPASRGTPERRLRELEQENASLRHELETLRKRYQADRELLDALLLSGLPANEHEMQEMLASSGTISDLLREFESRQAGSSK
jgi:hypothetical protein